MADVIRSESIATTTNVNPFLNGKIIFFVIFLFFFLDWRNERVHVTWFFGQNFLVLLSARTLTLLFAICDYFNVQLVFSFHSVKLHSTRDIFSLPTNFFKKERNCGRKKKETRQIFSFFFNLEIEAFARLWYAQPHTHTQTTQRNFESKKREEVDFKRFMGFSSLGKTNHRVNTNKTKTGISKN